MMEKKQDCGQKIHGERKEENLVHRFGCGKFGSIENPNTFVLLQGFLHFRTILKRLVQF